MTGTATAAQTEQLTTGWPRRWQSRDHQQPVFTKLAEGIKRLLLIWHRRAGKDNTGLNVAADEAEQHVGSYWHLYPTHVQARRAIWNGISSDGVRFIDQAFPKSVRKTTRSQDMFIEFTNGSNWQLCGSDSYDRLVGANPRGVVFSEWALCDPAAWDYIRPILRENGGWALFISTYRGRNHCYRMAKRLANNPDWYVDVRDITQTHRADGSPVITLDDVEAERRDGMSEALIQQEFFCNPMAAYDGAYYGPSMERLQLDKRIGEFAYVPGRPVYASWSLESDEQYGVVFWQLAGNESRAIASRRFAFESLADCLELCRAEYPWRRALNIVSAKTRYATASIFDQCNADLERSPEVGTDTIRITRDQLALIRIDNSMRPWQVDDEEENNSYLIDSLNGWRADRKDSEGSFGRPIQSWHRYLCSAVETFAAWRFHDGGLDGKEGWGPRPSTTLADRARI